MLPFFEIYLSSAFGGHFIIFGLNFMLQKPEKSMFYRWLNLGASPFLLIADLKLYFTIQFQNFNFMPGLCMTEWRPNTRTFQARSRTEMMTFEKWWLFENFRTRTETRTSENAIFLYVQGWGWRGRRGPASYNINSETDALIAFLVSVLGRFIKISKLPSSNVIVPVILLV